MAGYGFSTHPAPRIGFFIHMDPAKGIVTTESFNDGNWHFLVGVYTGSTSKIYVDGELKGTLATSYSNFNNVTIKVGRVTTTSDSTFSFKGSVDDIRIFSRPLSEIEIENLYTEGGWSLSSINIQSPNGGESWTVGSTHNITWNSTNVLDVKIELSTNNGANWTTVIDSTPSNGIYSWIVPNTPSIQSLIRISNTANLSVYDESDSLFTIEPVLSTSNENIPIQFALYQNYPNPFNPTTTIKYQIPELSFVTLKVYDVLGSETAILVNEEKPIGTHTIEFDATTLTSGIYFYQLQTPNFTQTKKMILLK